MTGGDPRHRGGKATERSNGKPRKDIVLGEPAWSPNALHNELTFFAVERLEMMAISARHLDSGSNSDVKARFIVQQNDVWKLARWMTDEPSCSRKPSVGIAGHFQISTRREFMNRLNACPRKFRNIALADKILAQIRWAGQRYGNERRGKS